MKKTHGPLLAAVSMMLATLAHADVVKTTFRINGGNVELVASNTTDAPVTVAEVEVLGAAPAGKELPVLFALTPGTVIAPKQETFVVLGKVSDIRRVAPRAADFERSRFCAGSIDPCLVGETAYESFNGGLGVQTVYTAGQLTQRTLQSMPTHFVTSYRTAQ